MKNIRQRNGIITLANEVSIECNKLSTQERQECLNVAMKTAYGSEKERQKILKKYLT
jgi:hypothetical protein